MPEIFRSDISLLSTLYIDNNCLDRGGSQSSMERKICSDTRTVSWGGHTRTADKIIEPHIDLIQTLCQLFRQLGPSTPGRKAYTLGTCSWTSQTFQRAASSTRARTMELKLNQDSSSRCRSSLQTRCSLLCALHPTWHHGSRWCITAAAITIGRCKISYCLLFRL